MRKRSIVLVTVAAIALIAGVVSMTFWLLEQSLPAADDVARERTWMAPAEPAPGSAPGEAEDAERRIRVTLFLLHRSGEMLTTEEREIPFVDSLQEQAKAVVRELLAGSRRGLASPIPRGVELRELFVTQQGIAYVDLSKELVANHPGGSSSELLTVYAVANTLIANFPAVKKVRILVEGREVETLAGHLDLTIPYGRGPRSLVDTERAARTGA